MFENKEKNFRKNEYIEILSRRSSVRVNRLARQDIELDAKDFENHRKKYAFERNLTGMDEVELEFYEFARNGVEL